VLSFYDTHWVPSKCHEGGKKLKGVEGGVLFENGMLSPPPTII
jgi:hypothetical protein